jgi:hypothetical protein
VAKIRTTRSLCEYCGAVKPGDCFSDCPTNQPSQPARRKKTKQVCSGCGQWPCATGSPYCPQADPFAPEPETLPSHPPRGRRDPDIETSARWAAASRASGKDVKKDRVKDWDHLPVGKFSLQNGYMLKDVPSWYLRWMLDNWDFRDNGLKESVEAELWGRHDRDG